MNRQARVAATFIPFALLFSMTTTALAADNSSDGTAEVGADRRAYLETLTPEEISAIVTADSISAVDDPSIYAWEESFARLVERIRSTYPDDFSGEKIDLGWESGEIRFKADVPSDAAMLITELENVRTVTNTGYSAQELDKFTDDLLSSATASLAETTAMISVLTDPASQYIKVIASPSPPLTDRSTTTATPVIDVSETELKEAVNGFLASESNAFHAFEIAFEVSSEQDSHPELSDGGRTISSAQGRCTAAFPVKSNSGPELGLLTAGHCPGTGWYDGTFDAFYPAIPYSQATTTEAPAGDFRWNHSKYMLSGYTYVGSPTQARRKFSSAGIPGHGYRACKYGITSGYSCGVAGYFAKTSYTGVPENSNTYKVGGLTCVTTVESSPGDSGGPWFSPGGTAYGVHHGRVDGHSCFSSVTNALSRFGIHLWVG